jgi:hypothetical protein
MLANIIKLIHLIIVFLVAIAPLYPNRLLKKTVFILLLYLFFQYISGYERCGLTVLEYVIMGEKYQEGFIYRLINPIIKIPEKYFEQYLFYLHSIYIVILYMQLKDQIN